MDALSSAIDSILTDTQKEHYKSIKWITGSTKANGKSFTLAMAYVERAIRTGELIYISDHSPHDITFMFNHIQKVIDLLSKATGIKYTFRGYISVKAITVKPE